MKKILKRYRFFLVLLIVDLVLAAWIPDIGFRSIYISLNNLAEMLIVVPPIFLLLGLFDVWIKRETMIRLIGEESGLMGIIVAYLLGSFAAGPLYAAFPVAGALMKKGSRFSNILIFIGAWSTTKIPLLMFEASAMGWKFMALRFLMDIPVIYFIAFIIQKVTTSREKALIYARELSL
jgi:uncharacterized membrane protein YraQ (UPF0718 family)